MSRLERLPPAEARQFLVLAAMSLRAAERPPEVVLVVRTGGAPVPDQNLLIRGVVRHLLDRRRVAPEARAPLPLELDLADLSDDGPADGGTSRLPDLVSYAGGW